MKKLNHLVVLDNITFFDRFKPQLSELVNRLTWYDTSPASLIETERRLLDADSCITCWTNISNDLVDRCPAMECIFIYSHAISHLIDKAYVEAKGINVVHIPDYATTAVSEYVFAGMLALSRNLVEWSKNASRGKYIYENIKTGKKRVSLEANIKEWTLNRKKLGIVGMGKIGTSVALKGKNGFDMDVCYFSRTRKSSLEVIGIRFTDLEELFRNCDVISLHLPGDISSKFINKKLVDLMKPGSMFINTSVGHAVDEAALFVRLHRGDIYAFLDVFMGHPPRKLLKDMPNVLFTYRGAWFTRESITFKCQALIENIRSYLVDDKVCTLILEENVVLDSTLPE